MALWSSLLFSGCQAPVPDPQPEAAIATAAGIDGAVAYTTEGAPLDEGVPTVGLTLAGAVARGLRSSPELQAALARVRSALADAQQARLIANPILDFVLRFPQGGGTPNLEAGVTADLLSVLRRENRGAAADHRLRAAVEESVTTALSVVADVGEHYAQAQSLDELTDLLAQRQQVLARLVALTRSRLRFGEASQPEVTAVEAQSVELELELEQRQWERREARLALARRIGEPSSDAKWPLGGWPELPGAVAGEDLWLQTALDHRPEIRAAQWQLAALGDEAALRGSTWQELRAGANAQRDPGWSVGPSAAAALPLFDTGVARRAGAEAAIVEARHALVRAQRTAVEEVRRAYASYTAANASLNRVRSELVPLARDRRQQVENVYLAGQADVLQVLLAEQGLQAAQTRLVELEHRALSSLLRLERAVGGSGPAHRVGNTTGEDQ